MSKATPTSAAVVAAVAPAVAKKTYPPPALPPTFKLETVTLQRETFHRVYWQTQDPQLPSVAGSNRFDCTPKLPKARRYGVLYLGMDLETCWLETVVRDNLVRPAGEPIEIPTAKLTNRWTCQLQLQGQITLAVFADHCLVDLGETASNAMADDYERTQRWSELLHAHSKPKVDGIKYRSRFKNSEFCVALFDRGLKKANLAMQNARSINPATSAEIVALMNRYNVVPV